ncbi:hypothetical protein AVEN_32573-1 [Araneus ventricosus]|uniref:DUF4371 domain-containing protein n=1 Tax=Araneus ventricosus TaxID=182803 RepID=A0A4Y2C717_ARAVE|nr:hypothetical protein AVEN_32573-1 [Araneus ventricosus]
MAENSSVDSTASDFELPDLSSDEAILGSDFLTGKCSYQLVPGTHESILDADPDRLLRFAEKYGGMPTIPNQAESEEDADLHQSYVKFGPQFAPFAEDNIKPSFYEFTRTNESGLIEIDVEKLERKVWSLSLDETTEDDPSQKKINYGNNDKKALKKHADDKVHQRNFRGLQCASLFPRSKQVSENATLSLNDRRANQKATLACFVAENSLPFSLAPKLVELCQTLAKDSPALSKLKMERTAETYMAKTAHGVAKTRREELVAKLNKNYFSMNVDEATNNNGDKVINVLVRVYDDEKEKIITAHLGSRKENISTVNHIFLHLKELLDSSEISFSKVISCLLDNCNTMRGFKKGVEKLLRDANKNLLHIDGDLWVIPYENTQY